MKPMLIFQFSDDMNNEEKLITANAIKDGFNKGSLIIDSRICILSFDENGKMNYCTPKYAVKTD